MPSQAGSGFLRFNVGGSVPWCTASAARAGVQRAGAADEVAGRGLDARRRRGAAVSEGDAQPSRLAGVAELRAAAVRDDVVDL